MGWTENDNLQVEYRWSGGDAERLRRYAAELVALAPDVILATGATVGVLLEDTKAIPIVFANVADPVGRGFVESLARPGTNATGFLTFEYSMGGKWLELLREIAPDVKRIGVLRDSTLPSGSGQFGAIQSVAPMFAAESSQGARRRGSTANPSWRLRSATSCRRSISNECSSSKED